MSTRSDAELLNLISIAAGEPQENKVPNENNCNLPEQGQCKESEMRGNNENTGLVATYQSDDDGDGNNSSEQNQCVGSKDRKADGKISGLVAMYQSDDDDDDELGGNLTEQNQGMESKSIHDADCNTGLVATYQSDDDGDNHGDDLSDQNQCVESKEIQADGVNTGPVTMHQSSLGISEQDCDNCDVQKKDQDQNQMETPDIVNAENVLSQSESQAEGSIITPRSSGPGCMNEMTDCEVKDNNALNSNSIGGEQDSCGNKENIPSGSALGESKEKEVKNIAENQDGGPSLDASACLLELENTKKQLEKTARQLEKANNYNDVLREMVDKLSGELHAYRHTKRTHVYVQVDTKDLLQYTTGEHTMPSWEPSSSSMDVDQAPAVEVPSKVLEAREPVSKVEDGPTAEGMSIADSIKATAEAVVDKQTSETLLQQGYVYDEQYGMYYDHGSGYYYDSKNSLYYDATSGTYFYYNYDTGQYEFHSKVDMSAYRGQQNKVPYSTSQSQARQSSPKKKSKAKGERKKKRQPSSCADKVFKNRKERRIAEREALERKQQEKRKRKSRRRGSGVNKESRRERRLRGKPRNGTENEEVSMLRSVDECENKVNRIRKRRSKTRRKDNDAANGDDDVEMIMDEIANPFQDVDVSLIMDEIANPSGKPSEELVVASLSREKHGQEVHSSDADSDSDSGSESEKVEDELSMFQKMLKKKSTHSAEEVDPENEFVNKLKHAATKSETISIMSKQKCPAVKSRHTSEVAMEVDNGVAGGGSDEGDDNEDSMDDDGMFSGSSDMESGELSDTDSEMVSESETSSEFSSEEEDDHDVVVEENEIAGSWPPCIRIIVSESEWADIGTLFIVTCAGATIGREKDMSHGVYIPDVSISKLHAEIQYNETTSQYEVTDKGSQNGTFVNGNRISQPKEISHTTPLNHEDLLRVGNTTLTCHIHPGTDTCDGCEPGIVMAQHAAKHQTEVKFLSKSERKKQQKAELNQIKKRYGLKNMAYEDNAEVFNNPNYSDKAAERRKTVGSEVPGAKHETPASVHRPISSGNLGHKLLQKMGWKEGESLGKDNSGIQEPIAVDIRANQSAGLGSATAGKFSADDANSVDMRKAGRRVQAQQRYDKIDSAGAVGSTPSDVASSAPRTNHNPSLKDKKYKQWKRGETEFSGS